MNDFWRPMCLAMLLMGGVILVAHFNVLLGTICLGFYVALQNN